MCYDISFKIEIKQLSDYFPELVHDDQISMDMIAGVHIMGHAYGNHPVIFQNREDKKLHLRLMEWGCIPYYVDDEGKFSKQRALMLNARSEKVLGDDQSYWYKIRNRRCLMPVSAIYEHREIKGWKNKVPYRIGLKDQPTFFIPGLYSVAELPDKETGEMIKRWTFTIITRGANEVMKMIHNGGDNKGRMPLFLPFDKAKQWVESNLTPEAYKAILDFEMPSEALEYWPVYTIRGKKPREDDKMKDETYEWAKLPELGVE